MPYIVLTVSIRCPFCSRTSVEQLIAETERFDKEQMATYLSQQFFDCQMCSQRLPRGTWVDAHAELAIPEMLRDLRFPCGAWPKPYQTQSN
jgi:hypothetical protein